MTRSKQQLDNDSDKNLFVIGVAIFIAVQFYIFGCHAEAVLRWFKAFSDVLN